MPQFRYKVGRLAFSAILERFNSPDTTVTRLFKFKKVKYWLPLVTARICAGSKTTFFTRPADLVGTPRTTLLLLERPTLCFIENILKIYLGNKKKNEKKSEKNRKNNKNKTRKNRTRHDCAGSDFLLVLSCCFFFVFLRFLSRFCSCCQLEFSVIA